MQTRSFARPRGGVGVGRLAVRRASTRRPQHVRDLVELKPRKQWARGNDKES